jgi:hypothetical protein
VAVEDVAAVVEAFVKRGAAPETVGQSFSWSTSDSETP